MTNFLDYFSAYCFSYWKSNFSWQIWLLILNSSFKSTASLLILIQTKIIISVNLIINNLILNLYLHLVSLQNCLHCWLSFFGDFLYCFNILNGYKLFFYWLKVFYLFVHKLRVSLFKTLLYQKILINVY